jgi:hypothetical protein
MIHTTYPTRKAKGGQERKGGRSTSVRTWGQTAKKPGTRSDPRPPPPGLGSGPAALCSSCQARSSQREAWAGSPRPNYSGCGAAIPGRSGASRRPRRARSAGARRGRRGPAGGVAEPAGPVREGRGPHYAAAGDRAGLSAATAPTNWSDSSTRTPAARSTPSSPSP